MYQFTSMEQKPPTINSSPAQVINEAAEPVVTSNDDEEIIVVDDEYTATNPSDPADDEDVVVLHHERSTTQFRESAERNVASSDDDEVIVVDDEPTGTNPSEVHKIARLNTPFHEDEEIIVVDDEPNGTNSLKVNEIAQLSVAPNTPSVTGNEVYQKAYGLGLVEVPQLPRSVQRPRVDGDVPVNENSSGIAAREITYDPCSACFEDDFTATWERTSEEAQWTAFSDEVYETTRLDVPLRDDKEMIVVDEEPNGTNPSEVYEIPQLSVASNTLSVTENVIYQKTYGLGLVEVPQLPGSIQRPRVDGDVPVNENSSGIAAKECLKEKGALYELLAMASDVDVSLSDQKRAAVHLKEILQNYWKVTADDDAKGTYYLSNEEKGQIKATILDIMSKCSYSVMYSQSDLASAMGSIVWEEYPQNWPHLMDEVSAMVSLPNDAQHLSTGLLALLAITDVYLLKKYNNKEEIFASIAEIEGCVYHHCSRLLQNQRMMALDVIKHGLQFIYALSQVRVDLPKISLRRLIDWMYFAVDLLSQNSPSDLDNDVSTVWWNCREWAIRLLHRLLEWCGCPTDFPASYVAFAKEFFTRVSDVVLLDIISLLYVDAQRVDLIMPEELLYRALAFINTAVAQSHCCDVVKPHAASLVKDVLFPLLCYIDPEKKWKCDDEKHIRVLFARFEYWSSDECEVLSLLRELIKMEDVMEPILMFGIEILTRDSASSVAEVALHLLGELRGPLTRDHKFERDIKRILDICCSRLNDKNVIVKARAAWCIRLYSDLQLRSRSIFSKAVSSLVARLGSIQHEHIIVKVEIVLALHSILENQKKGDAFLEPYAMDIIGHVLDVLPRNQLEAFDRAVDDLLTHFSDKVIIAAAESISRKASLWLQNISVRTCDRIATLDSLTRTISYIFNTVEDYAKIMVKVERNISSVIKHIFNEGKAESPKGTDGQECPGNRMLEGEITAMIRDRISKPMWEAFDYLFYVYTFCDDQGTPPYPVLFEVVHLYLVNDTERFLAVPLHLQTVVDVCRTTLKGDDDWKEHLYAAKIMECAILQCEGREDKFVVESIRTMISLAYQRLKRTIGENLKELKPLLLLVVVAAFCTRPDLVYGDLVPGHPKPLDYLCNELLSVYADISGVHNRRMALFGFCFFLNLPVMHRPAIVSHNLRKIIEVCISIFGGLQRVMKIQSNIHMKDPDTDMWSESSEDTDSFSEDSEEHASCIDGSVTEKFETYLDKEDAPDIFVFFKETIDKLKHNEPELFASTVAKLTHRKLESLQTLIKVCEQRVNSGL